MFSMAISGFAKLLSSLANNFSMHVQSTSCPAVDEGFCLRIPSRKRKHNSSPARAGPIVDIESLGPVGGQISVIAPLPERLPGLIEGSLRPQPSFE